MTTQTYDKPLPIIDELSKPFWDHALEHRLSVQACTHCRHLQFPPHRWFQRLLELRRWALGQKPLGLPLQPAVLAEFE
jgi:hypothetical protein